MYLYSGSWAHGLMSGEGVFAWKTAGHSFKGHFRLGCPVSGIITTVSGRRLSVTFDGQTPILSPGLIPQTHTAIDTDDDSSLQAPPPLVRLAGIASPQSPTRSYNAVAAQHNGVQIDTSQPHAKDIRLSQVKKKRESQEHRCSCHDRPLPLLQGEHQVVYSPTVVYRGAWLDGNWHGRGQWSVNGKVYVGHWVCGLFTAIMNFDNAEDSEKMNVPGQIEWRNGCVFQGIFNKCQPTSGLLRQPQARQGGNAGDLFFQVEYAPSPNFQNGFELTKLVVKSIVPHTGM